MRTLFIFIVTAFLFVGNTFAQETKSETRVKFDPTRDPAKDLAAAVKQASKAKKHILLDIGGEWCKWCHRLDEFIEADQEVKSALEKNFILLKINVSKENANEKFLSAYPKVPGYPHYIVLDKKGKFLFEQGTDNFEGKDGAYYDKAKLIEFYTKIKLVAK